MEIVGDRVRLEALEAEVDRTCPDLVIVADGNLELPAVADRIFRKRPGITFLVLENHGREASLYQLAPTKKPIGELSPAGLIEMIRGTRRHTNR